MPPQRCQMRRKFAATSRASPSKGAPQPPQNNVSPVKRPSTVRRSSPSNPNMTWPFVWHGDGMTSMSSARPTRNRWPGLAKWLQRSTNSCSPPTTAIVPGAAQRISGFRGVASASRSARASRVVSRSARSTSRTPAWWSQWWCVTNKPVSTTAGGPPGSDRGDPS